jgi:predicted ATPase
VDELLEGERLDLAELNLRAGMKACENAAFDNAVIYFKAGRELLGEDGWTTSPKLMLELCSEEANACFVASQLDDMKTLLDIVLSREDISVEDKFLCYEVKIAAHQAAAEFSEAIDTAVYVRRLLGFKSPLNKPASVLTLIKGYMKTTRLVKNKTPEELANLPELTDRRIALGIKLIQAMATAASQSQPTLLPLCSFANVNASVKYGISESSAEGFAGHGFVSCAFGNFNCGQEMAKAAELLLEKPGMARQKSKCIYIIESMIHQWTEPLQGTIRPLLEGYQAGLESGDLESAGWNRELCFLLYLQNA